MSAGRLGRAAIALLALACDDGELRGSIAPSPDGGTYLAIDDTAPGRHVVQCGAEMELVVPAGTTYRFDYWGP